MPKYTVKHTPILHDGERYEVDAEIELTAKQAKEHGDNLELVKEADPKGGKTAGDSGNKK